MGQADKNARNHQILRVASSKPDGMIKPKWQKCFHQKS